MEPRGVEPEARLGLTCGSSREPDINTPFDPARSGSIPVDPEPVHTCVRTQNMCCECNTPLGPSLTWTQYDPLRRTFAQTFIFTAHCAAAGVSSWAREAPQAHPPEMGGAVTTIIGSPSVKTAETVGCDSCGYTGAREGQWT